MSIWMSPSGLIICQLPNLENTYYPCLLISIPQSNSHILAAAVFPRLIKTFVNIDLGLVDEGLCRKRLKG